MGSIPSVATMNINKKFLEEALDLEKMWIEKGLLEGVDKKLSSKQTTILLESVRLRNEFNGTDEEYEAYLKKLHERYEEAAI